MKIVFKKKEWGGWKRFLKEMFAARKVIDLNKGQGVLEFIVLGFVCIFIWAGLILLVPFFYMNCFEVR